MKRCRMIAVGAALFVSLSLLADYNVRRPSDELRPQWTGAQPGKWTMDIDAAFSQAKAGGKCTLLFNTGSWWCPHCEAFEEKVILSDEWRQYITENGFYLAMLDFPYRGTVKESELEKSIHPELGAGWGFKCWLYDAEYLSANGLTTEDGLREIMKRYEIQKDLAPESASPVTIRKWDGSGDFTYGKVGYPTLIVYLPDGTEAGRFVPFVTNMEPDEARAFAINQLETIIAEALDAQCGLCSDEDEGGFTAEKAQVYRGWLSDADGVAGTIEVKTGKKNRKGVVKVSASVKINGKSMSLSGSTTNTAESVVLRKSSRRPESAQLLIGQEGLSGVYSDGVGTYEITGARDVFKAKDPEADERCSGLELGTWNFVLDPTGSPSPFADGYGTFTVQVKAKGKTKVSGVLGDGTKVSVSGQLIAGENGVFCLPLDANLYTGKKGGFSCNLWFKNGWLFNVTEISPWKSVGKREFTTSWKPIVSAVPGFGDIQPEMDLVFSSQLPTVVDGLPLALDPDYDLITVKRTKWTGTESSDLSVRCNAKTGVITGSMKFKCQKENGRIKSVRATVNAVMIGETAYGSVLLKKQGSWAIKISSCNACED